MKFNLFINKFLVRFAHAFLLIVGIGRSVYFPIYFPPVVMVFVKKKFIHQLRASEMGRWRVYDDDVNKGKTARNR